jgi:hypothetical protein
MDAPEISAAFRRRGTFHSPSMSRPINAREFFSSFEGIVRACPPRGAIKNSCCGTHTVVSQIHVLIAAGDRRRIHASSASRDFKLRHPLDGRRGGACLRLDLLLAIGQPPAPGEHSECADYGTGTPDGDTLLFVTDLLTP